MMPMEPVFIQIRNPCARHNRSSRLPLVIHIGLSDEPVVYKNVRGVASRLRANSSPCAAAAPAMWLLMMGTRSRSCVPRTPWGSKPASSQQRR